MDSEGAIRAREAVVRWERNMSLSPLGCTNPPWDCWPLAAVHVNELEDVGGDLFRL